MPLQPDGNRFAKVLLTVDNGKRVTMSLPESARSDVVLSYASRHPSAVTFIACDGTNTRETQFNGGFLLRVARCVPLDVAFDGRTERVVLSFGAGKCPT